MGKKRVPELSVEQLKELENCHRNHKSHALRIRSHIILLKHQSRSSKDIASMRGYPTQSTINTWLTRYEKDGILGLNNVTGQGRKKILQQDIHEQKVKEVVKLERQRLNIAKNTLEKDLNLEFSKRTLIRFLKKLTEPIKESENA